MSIVCLIKGAPGPRYHCGAGFGPFFLRMHQFDALAGVQDGRREPSEFVPSDAAQKHAAQPEEVQAAAPVGQVHHGIRRLGEVGLPVLGDVAPRGQVERVVAPALGHAIDGHRRPVLLRPLGVAAGVAVELHPLGGEVPEAGDLPGFRVQHDGGQLGALHGHVDAFHPPHLLHPGKGVLGVQDDDEARAVAGVLLLPQLQQMRQVKPLSSCTERSGEDSSNLQQRAEIMCLKRTETPEW